MSGPQDFREMLAGWPQSPALFTKKWNLISIRWCEAIKRFNGHQNFKIIPVRRQLRMSARKLDYILLQLGTSAPYRLGSFRRKITKNVRYFRNIYSTLLFLQKALFFGKQLISVLQAESHIAYLMQHRIVPKTEAFWRKSGALYFFLYGLHLNWPFSCFSYSSLNYLM